jgi:hypothetical protein
MLEGSNSRFRILRSFAVYAAQDDGTVHSGDAGARAVPGLTMTGTTVQ